MRTSTRLARHWPALAAGAGLYALALMLLAPATLADAALKTASDGRARLAEAQGTLWSGNARLEIRDPLGRNTVAERIAWRFLAGEMLRARLAYEIVLGPAARAFPVAISWSGLAIANADIVLPATVLGLGVPGLGALELAGEVQLQVPKLAIARGDIRGSAMLLWREAGSGFSPVSPLGDYELRLDGEGPAVRARLRTVRGPLQLDGQGSWSQGGKPALLVTAQVPPDLQPQLSPLLRLIATEQGAGRFGLQR